MDGCSRRASEKRRRPLTASHEFCCCPQAIHSKPQPTLSNRNRLSVGAERGARCCRSESHRWPSMAASLLSSITTQACGLLGEHRTDGGRHPRKSCSSTDRRLARLLYISCPPPLAAFCAGVIWGNGGWWLCVVDSIGGRQSHSQPSEQIATDGTPARRSGQAKAMMMI
jgi:hypothetical protein